ncbi:DUF6318 family protein [Actinotalea sp. JY-7876]|uniref:DUF6318 family protein n=1 Tax=Actinotalea sp. JY-7876 TaxID=2758442 RepID=UPI0015F50B8F|nr:DUF6318 family protein [Actinotalea sp. JY-7876]
MRPSRGTAALLIGVCAVGGLAGCTRDSVEPTPVPTVSSNPTATATPTPTPTTPPEAIAPERPAAMDEVSVAGAEAAAEYFLQLYPYVYATGDLSKWNDLSDPECVFCQSVVRNVQEQVAANHTSSGSAIDVLEVLAWEINVGRYGATITANEGPSKEFDEGGEVVSERTESQKHLITYALRHDGAGWRVLELDVETVTS